MVKKKITVDHQGPAHGRSVGVQVGVRRCTSLIGEPQVLAETDPSPGLKPCGTGTQGGQSRSVISFSYPSPLSCKSPMREQKQGSPCRQAAHAALMCLQALPGEHTRGGSESCKTCRACPAKMNILPRRTAWDDVCKAVSLPPRLGRLPAKLPGVEQGCGRGIPACSQVDSRAPARGVLSPADRDIFPLGSSEP